jgi:tRNA-Thr(GGU) m(6)t(6)A37 methyltransferase TsaA
MARRRPEEPSLLEWAALGLLCERPAHGWAIARELAPSGSVGRVYSCSRALAYRALGQLRAAGLAEARRTSPSDAGPERTTLGPTRRGRSAFARWRSAPVRHVRDLRSELMLKLLFHERAELDPRPLLEAQERTLARTERALADELAGASRFGRTLALWRLSACRGALAFVEGLLDSRQQEPLVYKPVGYVASPHTDLDGMPLQAMADREGTTTIRVIPEHAGCLSDLDGFSHVWVLAHLHETLGWEPTVRVFLDDVRRGTFATRSPRRPNPIGLSLARIVSVERAAVVVEGLDLLDGSPVLDLKPYVPLFDTPAGDVRSGWFAGRAERVFSRRSDRRFALRSRRAEESTGAP